MLRAFWIRFFSLGTSFTTVKKKSYHLYPRYHTCTTLSKTTQTLDFIPTGWKRTVKEKSQHTEIQHCTFPKVYEPFQSHPVKSHITAGFRFCATARKNHIFLLNKHLSWKYSPIIYIYIYISHNTMKGLTESIVAQLGALHSRTYQACNMHLMISKYTYMENYCIRFHTS